MKLLIIPLLLLSVVANAATRFVDDQASGSNDGSSWANAWTNLMWIHRDSNKVAYGDTVYIAARAYTNVGDLRPKEGRVSGGVTNWTRYFFTNGLATIRTRLFLNSYTELNGGASQDYSTNLVSTYDTALITNNINLWIRRDTNFYCGTSARSIYISSTPIIVKWTRITGSTNYQDPDTLQWGDSSSEIYGAIPNGTNNVEIAYVWIDMSSGRGSSAAVALGGVGGAWYRGLGTINFHHSLFENHMSDIWSSGGGYDFHHNLIRHRANYPGGCSDVFTLAYDSSNIRIYNNIIEPVQNSFFYAFGDTTNIYNFFFYGNLIVPVHPEDNWNNSGCGSGIFEQGAYVKTSPVTIRSNIFFFNNTWIGTTNGGMNRLITIACKDGGVFDYAMDTNSWQIKNNLFCHIDPVDSNPPKEPLSLYPYNISGHGTNNLGYGWYYNTNDWVIDHNYFNQYVGGNMDYLMSYGQSGDTQLFFTNATDIATALGYTNNVSATNSLLLADPQNWDFRPTTTNVNIGDNLSSLSYLMPDIGKDIYGHDRGANGAWSAGAIEYYGATPVTDTNALLCWLTFEDNFPAQGYSEDVSGNDARMLRYGWPGDPTTNFATIATGKVGSQSAHFVRYDNSFPWGDSFTDGQYGAITNLGSMNGMTQSTIMAWVKFDVIDLGTIAQDHNATMLDAGYGGQAGVSGWHFGRFYSSTYGEPGFMIMTNQSGMAGAWWGGFPTIQNNYWFTNGLWWHLAVTTDCTTSTNLLCNLYTNGVVYTTNAIPLLFTNQVTSLKVAPVTGHYPWIAVGCNTHNGTPEEGDSDVFPNWGWMRGSLDDVRIYNRILSAQEILNIANPGGAPPTAGNVHRVGTLNTRLIASP